MAGGGEDDLHVPPEICSEILTRVPVKSILRFRSVCKSWHSLISCLNFKPKSFADRILLNFHGERGLCSITSSGVSFLESRDHNDDLPNRFRGRRIGLIGSCDGLICLGNIKSDHWAKNDSIYSFIIYNPAIRKIVELPSLSFAPFAPIMFYYGFGFDSKAGDYKVKLLSRVYGHETGYYLEYFMFDLRNGVWRKFTPTFQDFFGKYAHNYQEFCLNDVVYWRVKCKTDNELIVEAILSFNLGDETLRLIPMPAELDINYRITTSRGLIYALAYPCTVWVMKVYGVTESWTKVFTIDMPHHLRWVRRYALILRGPEVAEVISGYCPNGGDYRLILHNSESGESKCLLSNNKPMYDMVFYQESLILM